MAEWLMALVLKCKEQVLKIRRKYTLSHKMIFRSFGVPRLKLLAIK